MKKAKTQRLKKGTKFTRFLKGFLIVVVILGLGASIATYFLLESKPLLPDDNNNGHIEPPLVTPPELKEDVTYFLIAGLDLSESLTDVMMVACLDNKNSTCTFLQFPRDTYVKGLPVSKLNAAYGNPKTVDWCNKCQRAVEEDEIDDNTHTVCGTTLVKKQEGKANSLIRNINQQFGIPIDHYIIFTIDGFRDTVDAVGGVEAYVPTTMKYTDKPGKVGEYLEKGFQKLNGNQAEWLMRHRKTYAMGDLDRVKVQRNFFAGFAKKMLNLDVGQLTSLLPVILNNDNLMTDMSVGEALGYVNSVKKLRFEEMKIYMLPGEAYNIPAGSYYTIHKQQTLDLINSKFMPHTPPITLDDMAAIELANTEPFNEDGQSFGDIGTENKTNDG